MSWNSRIGRVSPCGAFARPVAGAPATDASPPSPACDDLVNPCPQVDFVSKRMSAGIRSWRFLAILPLLGVAACQVTPPNVVEQMNRATGVDNAIVFHSVLEPFEGPSETGDLTPQEAVRLTLSRDYRIQSAIAKVRIAEADANQARLLPNPILNIDVRFPSEPGSNTAFEATLTGDLVSLLQKPGQIGAADHRLRESATDALVVSLDVMSEVQQAYIAAQSVDAHVEIAQKRVDILQQLRDLSKRRLDAGDGTRLDVLTLDAQLADATLDLSDLRLQRASSRLTLARLIGQPRSSADWKLSPWDMPPVTSLAGESAWVDAALAHRPEIQSHLWELRALSDDLLAAEFAPLAGGDLGVHTEHDPVWRTGPTFTIPVPIFDFGQASRAKIEAQRIQARHELAGTQEEIIQDVRLAYVTFAQARDALSQARDKLLPLQEQQRQQAQLAYRLGETDLTTLLLAETELQLTQARILDLHEKAAVAHVKLQRAVGGGPVAEALEPAEDSATSAPATAPTTSPASRPATGSGS
jgi:outer membrane protein, heavy metal efflux system